MSPALNKLFPSSACVAELRGNGDVTLLFPAESALLGKSVPQRAREFAAGRMCARSALAEFGIENVPIGRAEDRQPVWPPGMVGSITHTSGFCAAVVAARDTTAAIGIDTEVAGGRPRGGQRRGGVKPNLWSHICVASEIAWIEALPESERTRAATLVFSAKEAFYKCQYPSTQQYLSFHDASVDVPDWNASGGQFRLAVTRQIKFAVHASPPLTGGYLFHEEFVTAGVWVAAA